MENTTKVVADNKYSADVPAIESGKRVGKVERARVTLAIAEVEDSKLMELKQDLTEVFADIIAEAKLSNIDSIVRYTKLVENRILKAIQ